jgi:hypothetical protein
MRNDMSAVYREGGALIFSLTVDLAPDVFVQNGPWRLPIDNREVEPLLEWCTQRISHTCAKIPYDQQMPPCQRILIAPQVKILEYSWSAPNLLKTVTET